MILYCNQIKVEGRGIMNLIKMKGFKSFWALLLSFVFATTNVYAVETQYEMEERLSKMNVSELVAQAKKLNQEALMLENMQESSQSPEKIKEASERLSSIGAEMSMINTLLIALGAGALIASLSDDDDDDDMSTVTPPADTLAPIISVLGDNPAFAEFGSTYVDAGATARDQGQAITVTSSGTVDTSVEGTYTITYSATDAAGNTGTATRTVNVADTTVPVFTSSSTFVVDEGTTEVGTITATDLQAVTFSITGTTLLTITPAGVLSFISPADYESQVDNPVTLPYDGSTYDVTATVIATDVSSNSAVQLVTVSIRDVGGLDDNPDTGTGTNTDTRTEGSDTDTNTSTGTGTGTDTGTGTGTSTGTSSG